MLNRVDRDYAAGAGQLRAHHRCQPNATEAEDGDRLPRLNLCRVQCSANAREDGATEERGELVGEVVGNLDR